MVQQLRGADSAANLISVHSRHHYVGDNKIRDNVHSFGKPGLPVAGEIETVVAREFLHLPPGHLRGVLDDENAHRISSSDDILIGIKPCQCQDVRLRHSVLGLVEFRADFASVCKRNPDNEYRAFSRGAVNIHPAAHRLGGELDQRQADSASNELALCRSLVERNENLLLLGLRHTDAFVADDNVDILLVLFHIENDIAS